jgi:hypothetical protein
MGFSGLQARMGTKGAIMRLESTTPERRGQAWGAGLVVGAVVGLSTKDAKAAKMARADASHGASVVFQKNRCQRGMVTELERSVIAATMFLRRENQNQNEKSEMRG